MRTLPSITLDSEFNYGDSRLCFKIDVEGHELSVIRGAENLLRNNSCIIQCEIYKDQESINNVLSTIGYTEIFRAGPDHYFSNADCLKQATVVNEVVEEAIENLIHYSLESEKSVFRDFRSLIKLLIPPILYPVIVSMLIAFKSTLTKLMLLFGIRK